MNAEQRKLIKELVNAPPQPTIARRIWSGEIEAIRALLAERDALAERVRVLQDALDWYAKPGTYCGMSAFGSDPGNIPVMLDRGKRAKDALAPSTKEGT